MKQVLACIAIVMTIIICLGGALYHNHQIYLIRQQSTPTVKIRDCGTEYVRLSRMTTMQAELIELLKLKLQIQQEKSQHSNNKYQEIKV